MKQARESSLKKSKSSRKNQTRERQAAACEPEISMPNLQPKAVSASRSEMVEAVLPNDANPLGYILGGRVMHLIDIAGAIAGHRHSNSYLVTASVDYLDFRSPVRIGDLIVLQSKVNRVFHTSMEVGVKVFSENILTQERRHTSSAYLTFVAVDENMQRHPIRPLILETEEDRRQWREAAERRKIRLAHRYKRPLPS